MLSDILTNLTRSISHSDTTDAPDRIGSNIMARDGLSQFANSLPIVGKTDRCR